MPYTIRKQGDSYSVFHKGPDGQPTGSAIGTGHPSKEAAQQQIAAIYSHTGGKSFKAAEDSQRLAQGLLNQFRSLRTNPTGDRVFDAALGRLVGIYHTYGGLWQRLASGGGAPGQYANTCIQVARQIAALRGQMDTPNAPREVLARVMTIEVLVRQLALAQRQQKSLRRTKAIRRGRMSKKALTQLGAEGLAKMSIQQLKRELDGLKKVQQAARNVSQFVDSAISVLQKANQALPEDRWLDAQIKALQGAKNMLDREKNLTQWINHVQQLIQQKNQRAKINDQIGDIPNQMQQLRQPAQRPGLFGGIFGNRPKTT